jgi:hypothetical protein
MTRLSDHTQLGYRIYNRIFRSKEKEEAGEKGKERKLIFD